MNKKISILLCLVMIFTLFTACGGDVNTGTEEPVDESKVYEVNLNLSFPEPAAGGLLPVLEQIEEQSNGRIKFNIYYSHSLVPMNDQIDGLQDGVVDMAAILPYNYSGIFPLNGQIFGLPFLGYPDMEAASEIYMDMYSTTPELQAEFADAQLTFLSGYMMPPYQLILSSDKEVKTPADLAGMTLISGVPEMQTLLNANNCAPLYVPPNDYFSTLEKGVAEGLISHIVVSTAYGVVPQLSEVHYKFGEGGAYMHAFTFVLSERFYSSLTDDLKQIFMDNAAALSAGMMNNDLFLMNMHTENAIADGDKFVTYTDQELQVWKDAMAPIAAESLKKLEAENSATPAIYDKLIKAIDSY